MLITARSFPTTQRLHSLEFTLVNKSHSQHSVVAVRCEGRHFLILYACAHEVSFPGQIPRSLVWERYLVHKGNEPRARLARSLPYGAPIVSIERLHVTSSPSRLRRKTENSRHFGAQRDRSFYGDLHEMSDILTILLTCVESDKIPLLHKLKQLN